jgi:signal transduction histidine kinase
VSGQHANGAGGEAAEGAGPDGLTGARASDRIAEERAALRRVAVLAARGTPPEEMFTAVTAEVRRLLDVDVTALARYDADGAMTYVARWSAAGEDRGGGLRPSLGGRNVSTMVFETGQTARIDDFAQASGPPADAVRGLSIRSAIGAPVIVEGRLWGVMRAASTGAEPLPEDAEARLSGFTELVGAAIANAQARVELRGYAEEQAALRRVAVLVSQGAPPEQVFAAVAAEAGRLLGADLTAVGRYEPDGVVTLGAWSNMGAAMPFPADTKISLGGQNLITQVFRTRQPVRMDDYGDATGAGADVGHDWGYQAAVGAPIKVEGRLWGVIVVGLTREELLPADAASRLVGFTELLGMAIANAQARVELRGYAEEQAALRRVATLVARAAPPEETFAAVTEEIGRMLGVDFTVMSRYDADDTATVVGLWTGTDLRRPIAVGDRQRLDGWNATTLVGQTGEPVRIDDYGEASGTIAAAGRAWGFRSAAGVPINVGGRLWGVVIVGSAHKEPLPADTEARLAGFTELVGTAIVNAEVQAALAASRARIVAAGDEARRRIERNLHDGAQQRLVTLALQLREAQAATHPRSGDLARSLDDLAAGLQAALEELREVARGIHPVLLVEGGLGPALKALARRCLVQVDLRVQVPGRPPAAVEIAAYYVVSEALTNITKHAAASAARVEVTTTEGVLRVGVYDNGCGGAAFGSGTGLIGLRDRVEALGGRIAVHNLPDAGTALEVDLPLREGSARGPSRT